jgi:hypothetical protein
VAARDEIGMRVRIADIDPHRPVPAIGDRRQVRMDRPAKIGDDVRQRVREVLVFTPSRTALADLVNALLDMPITAGGAFGPPPLAAGRG